MTEEKNDINNLFYFPVENEIVVIVLFFSKPFNDLLHTRD